MSENDSGSFHMGKFKVAIEHATDMMIEPLDYDSFMDAYGLENENYTNVDREYNKSIFSQVRTYIRKEILENQFRIADEYDSQEFFANLFIYDEKMRIKKLMNDYKETILDDENTEVNYKEVFKLLRKVDDCNNKYKNEIEK